MMKLSERMKATPFADEVAELEAELLQYKADLRATDEQVAELVMDTKIKRVGQRVNRSVVLKLLKYRDKRIKELDSENAALLKDIQAWRSVRRKLMSTNAALLEACLDASRFLMGKARRDPEEREIVFQLNEAIRKAKEN